MNVNYAQARTIHDDKHKNYFDNLQRQMQMQRTAVNSGPTLKRYTEKGNINHEQPRKTTDQRNFHTQSLNHSVIPMGNNI